MASETIERLADQFRANRERFEGFCRSLNKEELERPVPNSAWQVKDFVSHLATLDTVLTEQLRSLAAGKPEALQNVDGSPFDVDKWNNAAVEQRNAWTLDQMLMEASRNRAAFLEALSRLTDEQIDQTMHFAGDNKRDPADIPFKLFLSGLARHDPIHVADMVKALPERADDPEIKAWLDDSVVQWYQTTMAGPARR